MKKILIVALFFLTVLSGQAEIKFLRGRLAEATSRAATEKKPVMIDFITDWCRWCDTLDARTYSDSKVAAYINEHVVPIKIDAEKGDGVDIAKKYGVAAYPTIIFIRPDGEEIDRILGYVAAEPFLKTATDYVNGVNTLSTMVADVKTRPNDPELQYALASKYMDRNDSKQAIAYFKRLIALDPNNKLGHNEEAMYNVAVATFKESNDPKSVEAFVASYPESKMVRNALYTVWHSYTKAKDGPNARKYFDEYIGKNPEDAVMMNNYAWGCAENGINLDQAAEVARKAVELASKDNTKAGYLDTFATVQFVRGNVDEAIALEQQALDMLKNVPGAKLTEYEKTMAKFKAGKKSSGIQ